jgi:hypothetical protein
MNAVYIYYTPDWQPLADIVLPKVREYAEIHQYLIIEHQWREKQIMDMPLGYYKMHYIEFVLSELGFDLIWLLDLDTLITNTSIPFTDFTDNEHDIFITEDIHGINAGSWIIRNTEAARLFVRTVINNFDAPEEQTVMKRYLDMVKVKILPHPSINSYKYELYKDILKDELGERAMMHEEGQWELGDLLLHLPGTTLEQRIETFKATI